MLTKIFFINSFFQIFLQRYFQYFQQVGKTSFIDSFRNWTGIPAKNLHRTGLLRENHLVILQEFLEELILANPPKIHSKMSPRIPPEVSVRISSELSSWI